MAENQKYLQLVDSILRNLESIHPKVRSKVMELVTTMLHIQELHEKADYLKHCIEKFQD